MQSDSEFRIPIKLKFENPDTAASNLSFVLEHINQAIFDVELKELGTLSEAFPELPPIALDAARYRIQRYENKAFLIEEASSGCIVLGGAAALLALWLLQITLGETIKEAWKEDEWNKKLKTFLAQNFQQKLKMLAERIENLRPTIRPSFGIRRAHQFQLDVTVDFSPQKAGISIHVHSRLEDLPPTKLNFADSKHAPKETDSAKKRKSS
jgi:hypothetical protein